MWANHDWLDIHPCTKEARLAGLKLLYPGTVFIETWEHITNYVIEKYFKHSSYWKIDGKPYFSIYDLTRFIDILGSVENTRAAIVKSSVKK